MADDERLSRLEMLLRIDERIAVLEKARPERSPWWRNAPLVVAYGGVLALVPALVTGVSSYFQNQRQYELARREHEQQQTLAYLQLAVDAAAPEATRAQVLRFLVALDADDAVGVWATGELARVETKLDVLGVEHETAVTEAESAEQQAKLAERDAAAAEAKAKANPQEAAMAAVKVADAKNLRRLADRRHDRVDDLATRTGDAPLKVMELRNAGAEAKPMVIDRSALDLALRTAAVVEK